MTNPAYFGTDLALTYANGTIDISPMLAYATGIQVLIQSLIARQSCVSGSIIDSPNEGIDLRTYIKSGLTQADLANIPSLVQKQIARDQRVQSVTVTGQYDTDTNIMTLTETIMTALGPFTLTVSVSALTVTAIVGSP